MNRLKQIVFALGWSVMAACSSAHYTVATYQPKLITISDTIAPDKSMTAFLQPYKQKMDSNMNQVIGTSEVSLSKAQPESNMGNFVADAQLEAAQKLNAKVQVSVVNYGGLRIPFIGKGNITKGKIYELMPFDNMVTIVDVPGTILVEFCNHIAKRKGWPVSGLSFTIKNEQAEGILANGAAINPHLIYKVALSDYIANGGDDCDFLKSCKRYPSPVFLRDAIMDKVKAGALAQNSIYATTQNRIIYAD
ncbi:hypothetical protein DBR32_01630 [Taibaiella sp. KBW10]|uniref:5'-nucleotidase C-terminal domain-containing protein n=1 Tax=Taibaiella sp. KBW10 TaxID=2153357 RepID=UPI000F5B5635|nr:5'-nucleotidase [Taibaiella sp. KBW10]RQO32333.1 hypothetical protein DBR32_01630 [Taibaiella sp. KBW10]